MIPVTKSNLIIDSKALASEILIQDRDRFETGLSRTTIRILGFLAGYVSSIGGWWSLLFFDSLKDENKLNLIQSRMDALDLIKSDKKKEICSVDFQKQICINVQNYTKSAYEIKHLTLILSTFLTICAFAVSIAPTHQEEKKQPIIKLINELEMGVLLFGMFSSFGHWLVSGNALNDYKKELANDALKKLKDSPDTKVVS